MNAIPAAILQAAQPIVSPGPTLSMRDVIVLAGGYFDVPVPAILSGARGAQIVLARHVAMLAIRVLLNRTYAEIGRACGARDHTTVIHAVLGVSRRIDADETLKSQVAAFLELCRQAKPVEPADVDPFVAAGQIVANPAFAHRVSINTIRDFAAIVCAASHDAAASAEREAEIDAHRAALAALEQPLFEFVGTLRAYSAASDRARQRAQERFDAAAHALAIVAEKHFGIERKFK